MNIYLVSAGGLAFVVGLVHSVLGEVLIFRRMRVHGLVPTNGGKIIGEGHVRILWASWHLVTVLGWLAASALIGLAVAPMQPLAHMLALRAIVVAMLASSLLVLVGTKARHQGWVGLLGVAVLTWFGQNT